VESDECLGSKVISEDASVLDQVKYQFSQTITRYHIQNNLNEAKTANLLGLDKLSTVKLLRGYVENFALDSLISYVEKLNIPCQVKITSEEPFIPTRKSNGRTRKQV
jgi:predicted XRE-type DNA-binding protein